MRRPETSDDRHVVAKHSSIYPNEAEVRTIKFVLMSFQIEQNVKLYKTRKTSIATHRPSSIAAIMSFTVPMLSPSLLKLQAEHL